MNALTPQKRRALLLSFTVGSFAYAAPAVELATPVHAEICCTSSDECVAATGNGFAYCNFLTYCDPHGMNGVCGER